jgi:hypothetical protein
VHYDPSHIQPVNLSTVIGESAAIATQGHDGGLHTLTGSLDPASPLRRIFALRGAPLFPPPRPSPVLPVGTPPGTDSNPSPLAPQSLSGRPGPERGAPPSPPRREQKSGISCSGRLLTEMGDCGWIECPNQLVGWGQPPGGAKKAPRERQNFADMRLFAVVRSCPRDGVFPRRLVWKSDLGSKWYGGNGLPLRRVRGSNRRSALRTTISQNRT